MEKKKPIHLYIHYPYCQSICPYCNFFVLKTKQPKNRLLSEKYLEEIETRFPKDNFYLSSVFFGGGTPSLMPNSFFKEIFNSLKKLPNNNQVPEFSLEANPEDLSQEKIHSLKEIGFNRISVGVQSGSDNELKFLGRKHRKKDLDPIIKTLCDLSFKVNLDLIFGSKATFNSSGFDGILEFLKDYPVHHFSAYGLTIEENTLFHKKIKKKLMELPDQDFQANQYKYIEKNLELLGFRHYELSNYARNDEFCHHNQSIWQGQDYLGIGPSAWGGRYFGKKAIRRQNPANLEDYFKNQNIVSNESNSLDLAQELLLWGLRNYKGANWPFISSCLNDKIGLSELLLRFPFIYEKDQNLHCVKEKWLILDALTAEIFAFFNEKMA